MKTRTIMAAVAVTLLAALALVGSIGAQERAPMTHTIFVSAIEVKGGTTVDKLEPPSVNPHDMSKGYEFKAPGAADKNNPQRWEVSSYMFAPAFVTVRQGDKVRVTAFVVNGEEHEVYITGPDGARVVPATKWKRGREYHLEFTAETPGAYKLLCSNHAPSMNTTFFVLPR